MAGTSDERDASLDGYWPSPWPGEDGGPARRQAPHGSTGLDVVPGDPLSATFRLAPMCTMAVLRDPGEVFLLRHEMPGAGDTTATVERIDPVTLEPVVTSPPYFGLRDYGHTGQLGLERSPAEYVDALVSVFREVRRVLKGMGTLWLNLGDSYAGSGKGGNPDEGNGKVGETARQAAVTNVTRKTWEIGAKAKDLLMIPARVAMALQADGWLSPLRHHLA